MTAEKLQALRKAKLDETIEKRRKSLISSLAELEYQANNEKVSLRCNLHSPVSNDELVKAAEKTTRLISEIRTLEQARAVAFGPYRGEGNEE